MNQNEQIRVRLKSNPLKVREMTARAFEVNSDRWEMVPDSLVEEDRSQLAIQAMQKKRLVKDVGETETIVQATEEHKTEFVDVDFQSIEELIPATLENPEIDTLRSEYEIKSGKPADKRWKETRIKMELEKLNNPENA